MSADWSIRLNPILGRPLRPELPKMGNSTILLRTFLSESAEGMAPLSFFGSAQVNFKMLQRKTFSIATTENVAPT